ncbi:hypothetical protein DFH08DRAFT_976534 [Mycena albidolilacea]|uniref:Uncharacterized protein n=1 Tax=Mycena albidolilacea TaxID=1033008 RepID=A0AAD7E9D1_9AGAR|nr:hypothetical protein DFH08DRAFT_976534 [Mycena albidolilacea]
MGNSFTLNLFEQADHFRYDPVLIFVIGTSKKYGDDSLFAVETKASTHIPSHLTYVSPLASERWVRLQRGIVHLQLTQSIRMPDKYIIQANVLDFDGGRDVQHPLKRVHFPASSGRIPAPSTVQAGYLCTILRKASERGNGEQIPGSGVWAPLPRSDAFLAGHRRSTLITRAGIPGSGMPPASHSEASAAQWRTTTRTTVVERRTL